MLDIVFGVIFIFPNGQVQRTWKGQNPEHIWGIGHGAWLGKLVHGYWVLGAAAGG